MRAVEGRGVFTESAKKRMNPYAIKHWSHSLLNRWPSSDVRSSTVTCPLFVQILGH